MICFVLCCLQENFTSVSFFLAHLFPAKEINQTKLVAQTCRLELNVVYMK